MPSSAAGTSSNYYGASPALRLLRLAFGAVERVWPALAARAAYRVFGTPLPLRWRPHTTAWPAGWRQQHWPFEHAGLVLHHAPPPGAAAGRSVQRAPCALLVHGWGGTPQQMRPLADALAAAGWEVAVLALPAHGEAAGRTSNLPQFVRAIEAAAARLAHAGTPPQLLAAHSLGATAAAFAAASGLPVERLLLLAPAASPLGFTHYFANVFGLTERTRGALQARIEAQEGIAMAALDARAMGPRVRARTLVVHDRSDRVNRFADGEAFAGAITGATLLPTDGLGHRRLLGDADVLARCVAWAQASAKDGLAPAPGKSSQIGL